MNATERQEIFDLVKETTQWSDAECNVFIENYIKEELTRTLNNSMKIVSEVEFVASLTGPQKQYYASIAKTYDKSETELDKAKKKFRDKERSYVEQINNLLAELGEIKETISEVIRNKGK